MTDIVERLREIDTDQKYLMEDVLEAAAEIERLRALAHALELSLQEIGRVLGAYVTTTSEP